MKRIAIFAHYDKDNLIEDYVLYYLSELKKNVDDIIFVSDSNIKQQELDKIKSLVRHYIVGKHGEYDFGSYKRGFQWANKNLNLANYEELIFCNDSCYGPIYPFENTFDSMSHKNLDFWGITENSVGFVLNQKREFESGYIKHIQSYFIVFKSQIFLANYFIEFIESIQKENLKNLVILKYEQGLSQLLIKKGCKFDVYCELSKQNNNSHIEIYEKLVSIDKSPLVKTSIYRSNNKRKIIPNYKILKQLTNYDLSLIKKDVRRNKYKITLKEFLASIFSIHNNNGYKILTFLFINFKLYKRV